MSTYVAKALSAVHSEVKLAQPDLRVTPEVTLNSPADLLFTDLTKRQAVSVLATTQIDAALQQMIAVGLRLLFVTDSSFRLVGLITSYDIAGEKPLLYLQSIDGHINSHSRETIQVQHIMQPISTWRVLEYSVVERAQVGDIVETFKQCGKRHLMVLQYETLSGKSEPLVRGLFSARQFERALDITFDIGHRSDSFAELERSLNHPLSSLLLESNLPQTHHRPGRTWG